MPKKHSQTDTSAVLSYASYCNLAGLGGGAEGPPGYALQGFHLLGEPLDVRQVTGKG